MNFHYDEVLKHGLDISTCLSLRPRLTYGGPALLPVLPEHGRAGHGAPAAHVEGPRHVQTAVIHGPPQRSPVPRGEGDQEYLTHIDAVQFQFLYSISK